MKKILKTEHQMEAENEDKKEETDEDSNVMTVWKALAWQWHRCTRKAFVKKAFALF